MAEYPLIPLAAFEVVKAARSMPLAFVFKGEDPIIAAVLSLQPRTNAFVGPQGQWLGTYIPISVRLYPFRLISRDGDEGLVLYFDEESGLAEPGDGVGEPFLDSDGNLSAAVGAIGEALLEAERSKAAARQAAILLYRVGVLQPWELTVRGVTGTQRIDGLYRVDEDRLAALDNQSFVELRSASAISLAYAQLFSTGQLEIFEQLAKVHQALAQAGRPAVDLDGFGLASGDTIRFD